ncbi:MAG: rubredoxin [bacterium]
MIKYQCKICGYTYDPEQGQPKSGIFSGTTFEEIHDFWVCPQCGEKKRKFEKVKLNID